MVTSNKPHISLLLIDPGAALPALHDVERVLVAPAEACVAGSGDRVLHSAALPSRRMNLAISLASGEWVVPISSEVEIPADLVEQLEPHLCVNAKACAIELHGDDGARLFAIRREAFSYGALDERVPEVEEALFDWAYRIFPRPAFRNLESEGIVQVPFGGLRRMKSSPSIAQEKAPAVRRELKLGSDISLPSTYSPAQFWEDGTADYVKWEVFQPDEPEIEEALALTAPRRVLELGCSAGRNIRYFANAEQYSGIDIAANLLRRAADRATSNTIGLIRGDVVRLPFADASFDLVFADSTVQHVEPERIEDCIADILRVSARYVCLIEFVDEMPQHPGWFKNIHMFRHDYARLMEGRARLLQHRLTRLQIQPAHKEYFLFEKI